MSERFVVVFAPTGGRDTTPGIVRLRRLLKAAGRAYGLRAVRVVADLEAERRHDSESSHEAAGQHQEPAAAVAVVAVAESVAGGAASPHARETAEFSSPGGPF